MMIKIKRKLINSIIILKCNKRDHNKIRNIHSFMKMMRKLNNIFIENMDNKAPNKM